MNVVTIFVVYLISIVLSGCTSEYKYISIPPSAIIAEIEQNNFSCKSLLLKTLHSASPPQEKRAWHVCKAVNDAVSRRVVDVPFYETTRRYPRFDSTVSMKCPELLRDYLARKRNFTFELSHLGPPYLTQLYAQGTITVQNVLACAGNLDGIIASAGREWDQHAQKLKNDQEFLRTASRWLMWGAGLVVALFFWSRREQLYSAFVPHPAERQVTRALARGDRVATAELKRTLEKTTNLAGAPPAGWKSKVMAEKAAELAKRIDKDTAIAEAAMKHDRVKYRAELERKARNKGKRWD